MEMDKKNILLGGILIFVGASLFLKSFNINPADILLLIIGIYFLYLYNSRKQQPHLVIGGISVAVSAISILSHVNIFKIDISGGIFFIVIGALFLFLYFNKDISGFVFPGCILPCIGIYTIIVNNMNQRYSWPSIFLLLAAAFFAIYFIEYMDRENWPLIAGILLFALAVVFYAFAFGFRAMDISKLRNLVWPTVLILIGSVLLIKNLRLWK